MQAYGSNWCDRRKMCDTDNITPAESEEEVYNDV